MCSLQREARRAPSPESCTLPTMGQLLLAKQMIPPPPEGPPLLSLNW